MAPPPAPARGAEALKSLRAIVGDYSWFSIGFTAHGPLRWTRLALDIFKNTAGAGIPATVNGEPMAGTSAPITLAGAGIRPSAPGDRFEAPVVARGMQRELQHSERGVLYYFAAGDPCAADPGHKGAARADHELPDARGAHVAGVVLGSEALVIVAVARQHDFRAAYELVAPDLAGAAAARGAVAAETRGDSRQRELGSRPCRSLRTRRCSTRSPATTVAV